jgi:hypothetical protein
LQKRRKKLVQKFLAGLLTWVILASNLAILPVAHAASLLTGSDTLGDQAVSVASAHSLSFATQTDLATGSTIELYFGDFTLNLTNVAEIGVSVGPLDASINYDNTAKTVTLTLPTGFVAGSVSVNVVAGKITNPGMAGSYSVSIVTRDPAGAVQDRGIAMAEIGSGAALTILVENSVVVGGNNQATPPPTLSSITLPSQTNDTTPTIQISANGSPLEIALSCNAGSSWSSWLPYPGDNELNTNSDADFNITNGVTGCSAAAGTKTISAKVRGDSGESSTVSGTTNYDLTTSAPILSTPAASGIYNATEPLNFAFSLPETAKAGSVVMTLTRTSGTADAGSPHAFVLAGSHGLHGCRLDR